MAITRIRQGIKSICTLALCLVLAFLLLELGLKSYYRAGYQRQYADIVEHYSRENGISPSLVYAVIHTESGFRPRAESHVGARGLMQITPDTFEWLRYRLGETDIEFVDLFEPEHNIRYGAYFLAYLLAEFDSLDNSICAYHAGLTRVKNWLTNPEYAPDGHTLTHIPIPATRYYLEKVTRALEIYTAIYT